MREMKDSEVGKIDAIPAEWSVVPIKSMFSFGRGLPITKQDLKEKGAPVVSYGQVHAKGNTGVHLSQNLIRCVDSQYYMSNSQSLAHHGDFIFADTSEDLAGSGNAVYVDTGYPVFGGYHTIILKSKYSQNNRYLAYVFQTNAWRYQIRSKLTGVKVYSITQSILGGTWTPMPSEKERQIIVDYLDRKCSAIDTAISHIQKQIENLEEYKKSVITQAVTKGLDPNVKMKNSGVEWIGEIPEGWIVKRLKYTCAILDSFRQPISAEKRTCNSDVLYDYYGASGTIDKIDGYTIDDDVLLIGEDGANLVYRNLPLIYEVHGKAWINNHAHILKPYNYMDYKYTAFILESCDISLLITGSAQPKLTQENLKQIPVVVPPCSEQKKIASYLDRKCSAIDSAITKQRSLIDKLTEYKQSVIYNAVTGKIDCTT